MSHKPSDGARTMVTAFGMTKNVPEWVDWMLEEKHIRITASGLCTRLKRGMAPEEAFTLKNKVQVRKEDRDKALAEEVAKTFEEPAIKKKEKRLVFVRTNHGGYYGWE